MANILISHFSPIQQDGQFTPLCFFDGLANGFLEGGHNVAHLVSSRFIPQAWNGTNHMHDDIDGDRLSRDIKAFSPDLCIFANNSVPEVAYEATECPVILLLSDTVNFFNDKDKIKNKFYGDRIFFYAPFKRDLIEIESLFGADAGDIIHLPPATGVVAESIPVDKNISFIGSNFLNRKELGQLFKAFPDRKRLQEILETLRRDTSSLAFLSDEEKNLIAAHVPLTEFPFIFSARDRMLVLALLAEEGLALYGSLTWLDTAQHFPDVAASFDPRLVYSLQHNQDIYNSSRICVSIAHSQAQDGFPWRVMDIMASNGCLLSDRKQGLSEFTRGYVDLPMYDSPVQAHELARRLLKDEVWRKELVAGSQQCIAEKGRWKHRFRDFQAQVGVELVQPNPSRGTRTFIHGEQYVIPGYVPKAVSSVRSPRARWRQNLSALARRLRGR